MKTSKIKEMVKDCTPKQIQKLTSELNQMAFEKQLEDLHRSILPKEYKKEIQSLMRRFASLINVHTFTLTEKVEVEVWWDACDPCCVIREENRYYDLYESTPIKNLNAKITAFKNDVAEFGQEHFSDKKWLWENLFNKILKESWDVLEYKKFFERIDIEWVPIQEIK